MVNLVKCLRKFKVYHVNTAGYKTDHQAVLAFTDQCTSRGTGLYILGRPVIFSNYQDVDDLHTIRKRISRPFQ